MSRAAQEPEQVDDIQSWDQGVPIAFASRQVAGTPSSDGYAHGIHDPHGNEQRQQPIHDLSLTRRDCS
jgi:hypothetical protein